MSEGGSGGLEPSPEVGYVKTGKTAVTIAQMSGVGKTNIEYLLAVKKKRPDLYEKVFDGSCAVRTIEIYHLRLMQNIRTIWCRN